MEAHYRAFHGKLVVKVEGSTIKELFEQIGPIAEVLDGDQVCGACGSPNIYPRARQAQKFTYYELVCSDCTARLSFGQHSDGGTIWAKREKDGEPLPNRGWLVYRGLPAPASAPVVQTIAADPPHVSQAIERAKGGAHMAVIGQACDELRKKVGDAAVEQFWEKITKGKRPERDYPEMLRLIYAEVARRA